MSANLFKQLSAGTKFNRKKFEKPKQEEIKLTAPTEVIEQYENQASALSQDQVLRNFYKIEVTGDDVPSPLNSFESLTNRYGANPQIVDNLKKSGYAFPTAIQMQAIPLMMDRREIISSAPTGSGKTLAFLIPILCQLKEPKSVGFRAIIVVPTRELAKQIHREFLWIAEGTGLRIHIINNMVSAVKKFGPGSKLKKDVLITTPNRLLCLLKTDPPVIKLKHLKWLVIDECDKLFEMGFRDQLAHIYKECSKALKVRRAMFSATFNDQLEKWFQMNLDNSITLIVGGKNTACETIEQELKFVGSERGKVLAIKDMIREGLPAPVLIFVERVEHAKRLFKELTAEGINADGIHSDRTQEQRDKTVQDFREGKTWFLICTELMGRGIDFKAVTLLINYDIPQSTVSYIHRIGRTGRAGRRGKAITFFTEKDFDRIRPIIRVMEASGCEIPQFIKDLVNNSNGNNRNANNTRIDKRTQKRKGFSTHKKLKPNRVQANQEPIDNDDEEIPSDDEI